MPKTKEFLSSEDDLSSSEEAPRKKAKTEKPKKTAAAAAVEVAENGNDENANESAGEEENKKVTKGKQKPAAKATKKQESDNENDSGDGLYALAKLRFVNVSEWKGKAMVNIREYYESNGKTLPGKKGISLSLDQWEKLKSYISKIDSDIKKIR